MKDEELDRIFRSAFYRTVLSSDDVRSIHMVHGQPDRLPAAGISLFIIDNKKDSWTDRMRDWFPLFAVNHPVLQGAQLGNLGAGARRGIGIGDELTLFDGRNDRAVLQQATGNGLGLARFFRRHDP